MAKCGQKLDQLQCENKNILKTKPFIPAYKKKVKTFLSLKHLLLSSGYQLRKVNYNVVPSKSMLIIFLIFSG